MLGQWNTFSKAIRPLSRWNEWFDDNHEGMQMGIFLSFPSLFSLSFYPSREISFDRAEESRIPFLFFFIPKIEITKQQNNRNFIDQFTYELKFLISIVRKKRIPFSWPYILHDFSMQRSTNGTCRIDRVEKERIQLSPRKPRQIPPPSCLPPRDSSSTRKLNSIR